MKQPSQRLYIYQDLFFNRYVLSRTNLKRLREREDDPFPEPIVRMEGKLQEGTQRYSGRRVCWDADEVDSWIARNYKKKKRD